MRSGRTLWDEFMGHYDRGVSGVERMSDEWARLRPYVDYDRWIAVNSDLKREQAEARWWRDASVAYWQSLAKLPLPRSSPRPMHPLAYYKALRPPSLPGQQP
jgi:alpha-glucuronidase